MDNLRVYLSTWNVATNSPNQDLNALLDFPSVENKHRPLPDFYALAFQEVKSQPQNVVMDALFSDPWTAAVSRILIKHNYVRVKSIRLQGLLLLVFCLRKHLIHLRDVESQYTRTGLGGMWGNKGAVSVRLSIYGCSVCVVNSHLSPHDHQLEERVADYNNIIKSNTFHIRDTSNIMYHDYVFWMGDLNFRLSERGPESPQAVLKRIQDTEKEDYSELLQHDQLRGAMASGDAFSELTEMPPRFPPTYKFEVGTSKYDEKRRPAWTDRILYKVVPDNYENVTLKADQLNYHSLPQYTVSDHKPVVSEFVIKVFSNYTERSVEFAPISAVWTIGDAEFVAKYTLSSDVVVHPNDWIAVYEADFDNLDDYVTYEYVSKVSNAILPGSQSKTVVFGFPVGSGVRSPGWYRFLYFSQPSTEVRSLLGISSPFEARNKEEDDGTPTKERPLSEVQLPSTSSDATASTSSGQQEARGVDSILRDFSNLHVPGSPFMYQTNV